MRLEELFESSELEEGVHDPHIFKAIFMIGGSASGKSFIRSKFIGGTGLKSVDVDDFYQYLVTKKDLDIKTIEEPDEEELYKRAGELTGKKLDLYLDGRLGLIFDGTGRKYDAIANTKKAVESLGYDTMAVFVNTDVDTAVRRNKNRPRTVRPSWVKSAHKQVQENIGKYNQLFGENFLIIDNSDDANVDLNYLSKRVNKFLSKKPRNPKVQ